MNLIDTDGELYRQLVNALYAMPPQQRMTAHWVMNDDWGRRISAVPSWHWMPENGMLLGKPVKVADDGGEPHMEAGPVRAGVLVEPGDEVVYIKCDDPDCPKHKPGLHHAHRQVAP